MFQLHDRTRRRLCLAAFALLGLTPTLLVGGWCAARLLPGAAQTEADSLGRQLGLAVKLESLKYLRPGTVLYEGLELADPETGQTLLHCRALEASWRHVADEQGQQRLLVSAIVSQPEVEVASSDLAWRWMQRMLEIQPGRADVDLAFSASEMSLRVDGCSQKLSDVSVERKTLPGGTYATVDFRPSGAAASGLGHLRVVRNRQTRPPTCGFELDTGDGELTCNVLALGLSELKQLGERCRFRGRLWAKENADGWEGEVAGQLVDLDLGRLVTDHFPHRLTGLGEATIQTARFRRGRLESGSGFLKAGPGVIDRSLVAAAVDRLGLVPATDLPALTTEAGPIKDDGIRYRQLGLFLSLDAQGMQLRGCCDTVEPGTILSDGGRRLLGEPLQGSQPVTALVQTFVPQNDVQVPASRQTAWLLHHLPMPEAASSSIISPKAGGSAASTAREPSRDEWQR